MKLREMSTNQAADALVRLAEPAAEIINDEKVFELIRGAGKVANAPWQTQLAFIVREVAPVLLRDHRDAVYAVLSIMTGKEIKVIAEQPVTVTLDDIKSSVDGELLSFFTPSTAQTKNEETK